MRGELLLEPEAILKELDKHFADKLFLTTREVSKLLRISKTSVFYLIHRGELEAIKTPSAKPNAPFRILKSSLIKYITEHYELNLPLD